MLHTIVFCTFSFELCLSKSKRNQKIIKRSRSVIFKQKFKCFYLSIIIVTVFLCFFYRIHYYVHWYILDEMLSNSSYERSQSHWIMSTDRHRLNKEQPNENKMSKQAVGKLMKHRARNENCHCEFWMNMSNIFCYFIITLTGDVNEIKELIHEAGSERKKKRTSDES